MANSFSFDGTDLSTYGLEVTDTNHPHLFRNISTIQLQDKAYADTAKHPARSLNLDVTIQGSSVSDLYSKLDSIKYILDTDNEAQLIFDSLTTRYFNARLTGINGEKISPIAWRGTLSFICPDPLAYSTTETSSDFTIDADPDTVIETAGGTAMVLPVYTLIAGETLADTTLKVFNITTDEELTWLGSLDNGDELQIDVAHWIVYKNGEPAMATISGQFPRLKPGSNSIKVTGFGATGSLNIRYRDAYL